MKTRIIRIAAAVFTAAMCLGIFHGAAGQTGGGYDLTWNSWDNSGGVTFSTGGGYELGATVGQADAGSASGGSYTFSGGFWQRFVLNVYVPVTVR